MQAWARVLEAKPHCDLVAAGALLTRARTLEHTRRTAALDQAFRQRAPDGTPLQRTPQQFAANLRVPVDRATRLLKFGIKDTPMPGDPEEVDVVWEDEYLIAVNKPPFVGSQPVHRHRGGSMVNRLITYLGYTPHVRPPVCVVCLDCVL